MTTKANLINQLSEKLGTTKKQARDFLDAFEQIIHSSLEDGDALIPGVGKLKVRSRAARTGRNPQTGAPIQIAAKQVVKLAAAKALKTKVAAG